jgi:hypothetical protein
LVAGRDGGAWDGAGEIGPGATCAIRRLGTTIAMAARNPQKAATAVFLVFKLASTSAPLEPQQVSSSMTVAGQNLPRLTPAGVDGTSYLFSCLRFIQRSSNGSRPDGKCKMTSALAECMAQPESWRIAAASRKNTTEAVVRSLPSRPKAGRASVCGGALAPWEEGAGSLRPRDGRRNRFSERREML